MNFSILRFRMNVKHDHFVLKSRFFSKYMS